MQSVTQQGRRIEISIGNLKKKYSARDKKKNETQVSKNTDILAIYILYDFQIRDSLPKYFIGSTTIGPKMNLLALNIFSYQL